MYIHAYTWDYKLVKIKGKILRIIGSYDPTNPAILASVLSPKQS